MSRRLQIGIIALWVMCIGASGLLVVVHASTFAPLPMIFCGFATLMLLRIGKMRQRLRDR